MGNRRLIIIFLMASLIGGLCLIYYNSSTVVEETFGCISCRTTKIVSDGKETFEETEIFKSLSKHSHDFHLVSRKTKRENYFISENSIKDFKLHPFISSVSSGEIYTFIQESRENRTQLEEAFKSHNYKLAKYLIKKR